MGPPDTKIVGIFTLAAAIKSPGTFLSQFGIHTSPSNPCAIAMHSVLSAIRSLVTREYFIPTCPMAIPSHTAIAGNTTGIPPAMATPIFTASVILSRFMCPGTISLKELTIPIMGRLLSSSVNPSALNRLLWGAWAVPVLTESLLIIISLFLFLIFSIPDKCASGGMRHQILSARRSPISVQPTCVQPSDMISPVRKPSCNTFFTAASMASASSSRSKL